MLRYSREMIAYKLRYIYVTLLILQFWLQTDALASNRNRRRPVLSPASQALEEVTDKNEAIPDQLALAASRTEPNQYRRGGAYASNTDREYPYANPEINLIRSGGEPTGRSLPHTQITTKYTSSITTGPREAAEAQLELDEAATAEEYVAKAMQMYGSRLHEPIRIPAESEKEPAVAPSQHHAGASSHNNFEYYEYQQQQRQKPRVQPQQQQVEPDSKQLLEAQMQAQLRAEMQQAQYLAEKQAEKQQKQHYQQQQQQQQQRELQQQHQQEYQKHQQYQQHQEYQQQQQELQEHHELKHHKDLQHEQALQQHQQALQQQQELQQNAQNVEAQTEHVPVSAFSQQPAPVYEKEPVTRSYELYGEPASYDGSSQDVDRHYHTKYHYQPGLRGSSSNSGGSNSDSEQDEEKIRVSASTEIPKAEIMKQIEKSVMKYMKELEAEGKIIAAPQEPLPKSYYKLFNGPATQEKQVTSTTLRPKYTSSTPSSGYNGKYGGSNHLKSSSQTQHQTSGSAADDFPGTRHHQPKHSAKPQQQYQSETETKYQAPSVSQHQELSDTLAPNVEFIYKIKTRAPLQTATVKTVSKPYTLPLKSYDHFDHTAALKNLEDFDLSHVVTTQDPEEHASSSHNTHAAKPSKLYFNSEIYHDINSLPYKPEKSRNVPAEYRKVKSSEPSADYKGYGGYFAEPSATSEADEKESPAASASHADDGYPVMNPYQFVLKKEPIPSKYEDSSSSAAWEQPRSKPLPYSAITIQKALEYDSYSPKFNNNPEGYGYQHSYKPHASSEREREREREREPIHTSHKYARGHGSAKRGKRGGGPHPNVGVKKNVRAGAKDIEASLALRPPPKA